MQIYFIKSGYGTYGGTFDEPFENFGRIISDRFQQEEIGFPYKEIEIQLACFSNKPKGKDKEIYNDWFNKLPNYYRGKSMVRVTLPVFETERTLDDVFKLIYSGFEIIFAKKKKDDLYNAELVKQVLSLLEAELQNTDLWQLNRECESILRNETLIRRVDERKERENRVIQNEKLIRDLRFYYHFEGIDKLYFAPYSYKFCEKIRAKLREKKFKLPDYTHLYIEVSDSFENALYNAVRAENWFVYGIAVLEDYVGYASKNETEKKRIVFNLIREGLNDIARIDKLDSQILNDVLDEVESDIK
ncbi:hypothetical protein BSF41_01160 [Flavobacterium sp. ACN2]|jgi:hypothetical protein|uniref:hypothetical protein n=1 Tax=unclassified Flavobacterium TaxID=196869 RepID=UPI000BB32DAD|nr:hypothetical protein [Flavobacterium sp. ACN2]PBI94367.1 hypothetical protein BSF41_01160 [Flavobacterium sp. ACN2]